jgi:hypothetical protein
MAGVDAKSYDLTSRIRAKRAALVRAGEVSPALPGEYKGSPVGGGMDLNKMAAVAAAHERREERAMLAGDDAQGAGLDEPYNVGGGDVEDTLDPNYELPSTPFDGDEEAGAAEFDLSDQSPDPELRGPLARAHAREEVRQEQAYAETLVVADERTAEALVRLGESVVVNGGNIEFALVEIADTKEQVAGVAKALVLIADAVGKEAALHDAILTRLDTALEALDEYASVPAPRVGVFWRAWRYLFAK